MSQAASQAAAFFRDVARSRKLWTVRDEKVYPMPMTDSGTRSIPFWSSESRVWRIIKNVPDYHGFEPVEVSWEEFHDQWLPDLEAEGHLIGVN